MVPVGLLGWHPDGGFLALAHADEGLVDTLDYLARTHGKGERRVVGVVGALGLLEAVSVGDVSPRRVEDGAVLEPADVLDGDAVALLDSHWGRCGHVP